MKALTAALVGVAVMVARMEGLPAQWLFPVVYIAAWTIVDWRKKQLTPQRVISHAAVGVVLGALTLFVKPR
jgi:hypothetical protein